jgi:hypothetical protein
MTTHEHWRSTTGLRTALTWLLSGNVAVSIGAGLALMHHNQVVDDYRHYRTTYAATQDAHHLLGVVGIVFLAVLVATTVVFIVWMWRSVKNNELLDRIRPRYTSGWSIGGWFIPIGNLWIPVRVMHDLWQGSDPDVGNYHDWRGLPRTPLIAWWWGLYLTSRLFSVTLVGTVTAVPAAILAIVLVRSITARQEAARLAPSSRTSGWYRDPTERFDHRYWDGHAWTDHASRNGEALVDPVA